MTEFLAFARSHGLDLDHVIDDGGIHRCKTTDKRHRDNGAYRFCGNWGWVQVWHEHEHPIKWSSGKEGTAQMRQDMHKIGQEAQRRRERAARKAREIVSCCRMDYHHYLTNKGFPVKTLVHSDGRMVIPMWGGAGEGEIVSVQFVDREGDKQFLPGGQAKGTANVVGPREGVTWYVEGMATGLSVLAALKYMSMRGRVVCCFFASNLAQLAADSRGYVFADHDTTNQLAGQRAAEKAGRPWVMSPVPGMDANDYHQKYGVAALAKLMRPVMRLQ